MQDGNGVFEDWVHVSQSFWKHTELDGNDAQMKWAASYKYQHADLALLEGLTWHKLEPWNLFSRWWQCR